MKTGQKHSYDGGPLSGLLIATDRYAIRSIVSGWDQAVFAKQAKVCVGIPIYV